MPDKPKIVYRIIHKPTRQVWSDTKARTVWPELNQAVQAYNIDREEGTPFYSAQNEYVVKAYRIGSVD